MTPRLALLLGLLVTAGDGIDRVLAQRPISQIGVLDPIGTWNCLIYQEGVREDVALLLRLTEEGYTEVAEAMEAEWQRVSRWRIREDMLSFVDERNGRRFQAGLRGMTLAGLWRSNRATGEWWCSPLALDEPVTVRPPLDESEWSHFPLPKPELMVAPRYPRQAIREAREGLVVVCFKVDAEGQILEPRIVQSSDPIFRDPTLDALSRSRYAPWPAGRGRPARPGCRTYRYELMQIYD